MTNNVISLIPQEELDVLQAYLSGNLDSVDPRYYEANNIPSKAMFSQLEIAVARIILRPIQNTLPNWGGCRDDGEIYLTRQKIEPHPQATALALNPRLICCVNWANSGPGLSWPESYHVTYIPWSQKFIVTSSRDEADCFGCSDHALGWSHASEGELAVSKRLLQRFWLYQRDGWNQDRWEHLFNDGLIDSDTAEEWSKDVWPEDWDYA